MLFFGIQLIVTYQQFLKIINITGSSDISQTSLLLFSLPPCERQSDHYLNGDIVPFVVSDQCYVELHQ